jgi:hypothetical protein
VAGLDRALQPCGGARHEDAERGRVVHGGQVEHDQRAVETETTRGRPVEHPAQVAVDQAAQLQGDVPPVLSQLDPGRAECGRRFGTRVEEGVDHPGQRRGRRSARPPVCPGGHRGHLQRGVDGGALPGQEIPPEARHSQRCRERRPTGGHRVACGRAGHAVVVGVGRRTGVERIEPDRTTRTQSHRGHAPRLAQRAVLPLRVDDPGTPAEDGLTPQVGLDEAALARADLADHDHVGIGDRPAPVEGEGVVDERAPEDVAADQDALVAESGLRHERVRRAQVPGGRHVGG